MPPPAQYKKYVKTTCNTPEAAVEYEIGWENRP